MLILDRSTLPIRFQEQGLDLAVCTADQLPDIWVNQIVLKSRQPHIIEHEGPEDVGTEEIPGRFRSLSTFREWSEKGRTMYLPFDASIHPDGGEAPDIAGQIWFGGERTHPKAPGALLTFAIRLFGEDTARGFANYRQTGLGSPFMQAAHADLPHRIPTRTSIWLDLVEGNIPAETLYKKNQYKEIDRFADPHHDGQKRILMCNDSALAMEGNVQELQ